MLDLKDKAILITGGSGYLGRNLVKYLINTNIKKIIVFSRDEAKHANMRMEIEDKEEKVRYIIGDVRDYERLKEAMNNVDYVIHAAALKRVDSIRYNPFEAVMTNIVGIKNVIEAGCKNYVEKVLFISSDKATFPVNLYGGSKFIGEQLMQFGHIYKEGYNIDLICCRYGNVAGSTGSIIPIFKKMVKNGSKILPLTDVNMSRFWFTVDKAIDLIMFALENGKSQDIIIPKLKSFYIKDLILAFDCNYKLIGNRGSEKLSELMINQYENYEDIGIYYILNPNHSKVGLTYDCADNTFMSVNELKEMINKF
jgi:UDP-N-acetylglucosamine 4,6-dehydratase/5-epimerase